MIRQSGVEPNIIEYLKTPPNRTELKALLKGMGLGVRAVLRQKGTPYDALDLGNAKWTDEQLLDFVAEHPILMNRPIVVTPLGVRLCRPSEAVLDILPNAQIGPFTKEDGEVVEERKTSNIGPQTDAFPALAAESFRMTDVAECAGQVFSDTKIGCVVADCCSKALGGKLPSLECSRTLL